MSNVLVAVRVRPMNLREEEQGSKVAVKFDSNSVQVTNFKVPHSHQDHDSRARTRHFAFDFCYWTAEKNAPNYASQETIYQDLGGKVLESIFSGFNACVLAYGQSGSGKTYTMYGMGHNDDLGLVPRICQGLFERMAQLKENNLKFRTEISFLEIYNERVSDLLGPRCHSKRSVKQTLRVREHPKMGPCVQDLSKHLVTDYNAIQALLEKGIQNRNIAATRMHDHSSRSHAIFTIIFTQARLDSDLPSEIVSKIQLVDLAGSERAGVHTNKVRLKEGANINKSLVALGSVICTLADRSMSQWTLASSSSSSRGSSRRGSGVGGLVGAGGQPPFVPYRDSVLTWLLKDSLGGNSKTIMVATISPASSAYNETVNTLRYAQRAKCIVNKPIVNEDPKVKLIRELKLEVERLRQLLANAQKAIGNILVTDMINRNQDKAEELTRVWIEKWNEFRQQQEITCNSCAHKFQHHDMLNQDGAVSSVQLLTNLELNVSEEHVQTVYSDRVKANRLVFGRCSQCNRPITEDDESNGQQLDHSNRTNLESDSSGLSSGKLDCDDDDDDDDGWSNADEFSYVDHKEVVSHVEVVDDQQPNDCPRNTNGNERQLSPIQEQIFTSDDLSDCSDIINDEGTTVDRPSTPLEDHSSLQNQNWVNCNTSDRLFRYSSSSDADIDRDSLDELGEIQQNLVNPNTKSCEDLINDCTVNRHLKELEQCRASELFTSLSCEQQKAQFASIQPQSLTFDAVRWRSVSSLNMAAQQVILKCKHCVPSMHQTDSKLTGGHVNRRHSMDIESTTTTTSRNSDDDHSDQRQKLNSIHGYRRPINVKHKISKRSTFEQRLQALKRRKRKKFAVKCQHKTSQSEESVNNTPTRPKHVDICNSSPPPLPLPPFLLSQTDNIDVETTLNDEMVNKNANNPPTMADLDSNVINKHNDEQSKSPSPLTCWKDVVNCSRSNQQPIQFDCTSSINCRSWPSCDSLTMVYIGPKWASEKDNVINSIDNLEDQLMLDNAIVDENQPSTSKTDDFPPTQMDDNLIYSHFWSNGYRESYNSHPAIDRQLPHDCCSCKGWSQTQLSGNWNDFPNHSDSTMTCAEVSTQTDSGIQVDHSFQPRFANHCNWSFSTIDGQSQTRIITVDNAIQTDAIRRDITAQTEPTTSTTGQQTDPVINSLSVQMDRWSNKNVNKCGVERVGTEEKDINVRRGRNSVTNSDNEEKSTERPSRVTSRHSNDGLADSKLLVSKPSSIVHDHHAPACENGIYIGFHGINKALRDIQVKVKLRDVTEKKEIATVNSTEADETIFQQENAQHLPDETTLEPPDEFKEKPEDQNFITQFYFENSPEIQLESTNVSHSMNHEEQSEQCPIEAETEYVKSEKFNAATSTPTSAKEHGDFSDLTDLLTTVKTQPSNQLTDNRAGPCVSNSILFDGEPFDDEYFQLPLDKFTKTVENSGDAAMQTTIDGTCTCELWKSNQAISGFFISYCEDEDISVNLPEDICQLLKECREVRKKAWHEITLSQHQLRLTTASMLNGPNVCVIHGNINTYSSIQPS